MAHPNQDNSEEDIDEPVPVAVAVRLRGQKEGPIHGPNRGVVLNPKNGCELSLVGPCVAQEKFKFDHILPEQVEQIEVYSRVLAPFVPLVFDGFDLFVLTYGGSGCGKSYTLYGPDSGPLRSEGDLGLIPRFVRHIFEYYNEDSMVVKVSSFDVTNDDICDLLAPGQRRRSMLVTPQDLDPATEIECTSIAEVMGCYESSFNVHRLKGGFQELQQNHYEKSHNFFKITVEQKISNVEKKSSVTFVDLAPSDLILGSSSVNLGLLSLGNVISALGDPRRNVSHIPFEDSLLTRLLKNAFGGRALTLLVCCISPLVADLEESLNCLMLAKRAANIKSNPLPNIITSPVEDFDEELSMIHSNKMPDLINNHDPQVQQYLMQQQFLVQQQQMLNAYMLMLQQQQQQQQVQVPLNSSSPFIPILSSPGSSSTMDLKSPLNVQMYLASNENQLPLNLDAPSEQQSTKTKEPSSQSSKPSAKSEKSRKSSLIQKTLDSILEESEHDSSTNRKSSFSSLSSSFDDSDNEDFDSENSDIISDEEREEDDDDEVPASDELFHQFKQSVDQIQNDNQDKIIEGLLNTAHFDKIPTEFEKKQSDLSDLTTTLEEVQNQILALDEVIRVKDAILDEVAKSSLEMRQARQSLESRMENLQQESSSIRKQLRSAQRSLALAEGRSKGHISFQHRAKVDNLRSKLADLRKKMEHMESCLSVMSKKEDDNFSSTPSYENLKEQKAKMEAKLAAEMEKKANLEMELQQDQLKISQLESQLIRLSFKEDNMIAKAKPTLGTENEEVKGRIEELRSYKAKIAEERHLLEHYKEHLRPEPHQCQHCRLALANDDLRVKPETFTLEHEKRLVEIDVLFEAIDMAIDEKNVLLTGHIVKKAHVDNADEQKFLAAQLEQLTSSEAKSLLQAFLHRSIDLQIEGRAKDRQLSAMEKQVKDYYRYIQNLHHKVVMSELDFKHKFEVQKHEYSKKMRLLAKSSGVHELERRLMKAEEERDHEQERAQRYKKFYEMYCKTYGKPGKGSDRRDDDDEEVVVDPDVKKFQRRAQKEIHHLDSNKVKRDGKRLIIEQPSNDSSLDHKRKHKS